MENLSEKIRFKMPVWDPRRGSYGNNLWQAFSQKLGRRVKSYSDIEYNHYILVESNPDIVSFCEQPVKVLGHVDDRNCASYMDMWILWRDGREEFREVKYAKDLDKPRVIRQIEIQRSWCERNGFKHSIITEKEIYKNQILLRNWKLILSQMATSRDLDLRKIEKQVYQFVSITGKATIEEILAYFADVQPTYIQTAIFRLIHNGSLNAPLSEIELTNKIKIEVRNV